MNTNFIWIIAGVSSVRALLLSYTSVNKKLLSTTDYFRYRSTGLFLITIEEPFILVSCPLLKWKLSVVLCNISVISSKTLLEVFSPDGTHYTMFAASSSIFIHHKTSFNKSILSCCVLSLLNVICRLLNLFISCTFFPQLSFFLECARLNVKCLFAINPCLLLNRQLERKSY